MHLANLPRNIHINRKHRQMYSAATALTATKSWSAIQRAPIIKVPHHYESNRRSLPKLESNWDSTSRNKLRKTSEWLLEMFENKHGQCMTDTFLPLWSYAIFSNYNSSLLCLFKRKTKLKKSKKFTHFFVLFPLANILF